MNLTNKMNNDRPKVAIIGAGSSGIIACQKLKAMGIPYDCFEKGSTVGGNWVYKNDNNLSAAYESLHINTSRQQMEFRCYPMPDHYPDFPHHTLIRDYFENFVDHFGLRNTISFHSEVKKAIPLANQQWQLELGDGSQRIYDALIVANGHHWDPRWPEPAYPGAFSGITMHAHAYLNPEEPHNLKGKKVVVLGMGNSAMDIACELGQRGHAKKVYLAARSGVHILPKYFGSYPVDSFLRHPGEKPSWWEYILPYSWVEKIGFSLIDLMIRLNVGRPEHFGLPKPKQKFGQAHPTVSSEIHIRLGSGDVIPKPNIQEFDKQYVVFADGSREAVDAVIYATGYNISFPFFDKKTINFSDNDLPLFKRIFSPQHPNLMFLGLVQPLCSIMPIAEVQAQLIGQYLAGRYQLPKEEYMKKSMIRDHEAMKKRYVKSPRHTIQINCQEYTYGLHFELKRGSVRARKKMTNLKNSQTNPKGVSPTQTRDLSPKAT